MHTVLDQTAFLLFSFCLSLLFLSFLVSVRTILSSVTMAPYDIEV